MASTIHKGNVIQLSGELPAIGSTAPDFTLVLANLHEVKLADLADKVKVLICLPSLDTSTCALETKTFNRQLETIENLAALVISKDLPFAMRRFCETEGIVNLQAASDFRYSNFAKNYGVELMAGTSLQGLHARAVFVLDQNNVVGYSELVADVSTEPNYEAAMQAIKQLAKN